MKKNSFLIVILLLANIFSASAKIERAFSADGLCNVKIEVDKGSNVIVTTIAGNGTRLTLTDGVNDVQLNNEEDNPLLIEAAEGAEIVSCKVNGNDGNFSGDGKLRVGITEGLRIEITTRSLSANPAVTFSVTDPSHIIVKADDELVSDISSPKEFAKGTMLTIAPADGYEIINVSTTERPTIPFANGVYSIRVEQEMTIYVQSQAANPVVTFEIDYPGRISVVNQSTRKPIDISSSKVSLPKGTVMEIQASDEKYSIKSVKVNGQDKAPAGGSAIYNVGVEGNMTVAIATSSTVPSVKFDVDKPENVKIHKLGSEEMLDVAKTYEMEKNTQIVIEAASDEVRIASVMANGMKLTPLGNGTYMTSVAMDMVIEVKTKGNLPTLDFKVDAPERINVLNGAEKLDISEMVELPIGTEITIEPANENCIIRSVVADGEELEAGSDKKYHVTVAGDMEFVIETAASLVLHIIQPEKGGTIAVYRDGQELHEGDIVITNDKLSFKNTPDENYFFVNYTVNNEECIETYTVSGSTDITVGAVFRVLKDGYVAINFDLDENGGLLNIKNIVDSERVSLDPSKPCEVKKGSAIEIYIFISTVNIASCTKNGVNVPADEGREGRNYTMTVDENATIKVTTVKLVSVSGEHTNDDLYNSIGDVYIKYKGEVGNTFIVPVGTTVELVAEPEEGYILDYYYLNYDESTKFTENTYTVENADREIITIKGAFKVDPGSGIESLNSLQGHYDAETMQIITAGGNTKVYTVSGKMVLESNETNISVSALENGIYIVKTQKGVFKLVKK